MSRPIRQTVIQLKMESAYGTDPGSWAAGDCLLISNPSFRIDRDLVPRNLTRRYFGASEQLAGTRRAMITFDVELAGAGAAGTKPAWGKLLRACGLAETVVTDERVEYNPITDNPESAAIRYFHKGIRYVSRGCRGTFKASLTSYERPMLSFSFMGYDTGAATDSLPSPDYADWELPEVVTDANSGNIKLGCTFNDGALSGGTGLVSRGIEYDLGAEVKHLKLLGGERIDISSRESTGKMAVELTPADEVSWRTSINANELTSVGFVHGSAAGKKVGAFFPAVQRVNPQVIDYEGLALMETELVFQPDAGNDEVLIWAA